MQAPDTPNVSQPTPISAAMPAPATLDYDQPLNERMRTFLRLEFLHQQMQFHQGRPDSWSTRAAVSTLLEILAITARGDVRGDVLKDLERQMSIIHDFQSRPGADADRVREVVANLARLRAELNNAGALFMQRLRDSEFLNAIKHRSTIPGGTCEFDLPDYTHWLNMPFEIRHETLNDWLSTVRPLCEAVVELLWLTRQNTRPRREVAAGGVYQLALDKNAHCQLLRITLPADANLFPEISGSHHRCSIRFLVWNDINARPFQASHDVPFLLTTCT
ncbi:MAG: cell division protein ZapD [Candidatus Obscuribacterales bacterium]|nr:cell division protein ZapD [Steroidobacteraceae bacterium]